MIHFHRFLHLCRWICLHPSCEFMWTYTTCVGLFELIKKTHQVRNRNDNSEWMKTMIASPLRAERKEPLLSTQWPHHHKEGCLQQICPCPSAKITCDSGKRMFASHKSAISCAIAVHTVWSIKLRFSCCIVGAHILLFRRLWYFNYTLDNSSGLRQIIFPECGWATYFDPYGMTLWSRSRDWVYLLQ